MTADVILHLVPDLRKQAGGIASVIPALAQATELLGFENRFVTFAHDPDFIWRDQTVLVHPKESQKRSVLSSVLRQSLIPDRRTVVHSHGLWQMLNHCGVHVAREFNVGAVISVHGMLMPWARRHKQLRKDLAWHLYQRRDLEGASAVHVTSPEEAEIVRDTVLKDRLHIIQFGVELSSELMPYPDASETKTLLFLGRLHPVKNLENLIRAFVIAAPQTYRLRLVGPEEGNHRNVLNKLIASLGATGRVNMPGAAYGAAKQLEIAAAEALVLASFNENFGSVVAEALAIGRPVIASTGTPWSSLQREGCGWWVDPNVASLSTAIARLTSTPEHELAAMGQRGRVFVTKSLSWKHSASRMAALYSSIASRPKLSWADT